MLLFGFGLSFKYVGLFLLYLNNMLRRIVLICTIPKQRFHNLYLDDNRPTVK